MVFKKNQYFIFVLFVILGISGIFQPNINDSNKVGTVIKNSRSITVSFTKYSSIIISNTPGTIIENQILNSQNITLINCSNSIIINNRIFGFSASSGIYIKNSNNTIIENNTIDNLNNNNSLVNSYGILISNSDNISVTKNIISNLSGLSQLSGIGLTSSTNIVIMNNTITNLNNPKGAYGITDLSGSHIKIINNNIVNLNSSSGSSGITLVLGEYHSLENNSITYINVKSNTCCSLSMGIFTIGTNNTIISNNFLYLITAEKLGRIQGINVRMSTNTFVYNNLLKGLSGTDSYAEIIGIFSDTSNGTLISSNNLENILSQNNNVVGIAVQLGDNVTIINNFLKNITSSNFYLYGIYFVQITQLKISDNILVDLNAKTNLVGIDGASDNIIVENNSIIDLVSSGSFSPYKLYYVNNSFISIPEMYVYSMIYFNSKSMIPLNYNVKVNGTIVLEGMTDYLGGTALDFRNISSLYGNVEITFSGTGINERYLFVLKKPIVTIHSLSKPNITAPINNSELLNVSYLKIFWSSPTDSYNHTVRYSLYYSIDNMNTWNIIVQDVTSNNYNLSLIDFGLNTNKTLFIKLEAYDGVGLKNTTTTMYNLIIIIKQPSNTNTTSTDVSDTTIVTTTTLANSNSSTDSNSNISPKSNNGSASSFEVLELLILFMLVVGSRIRRKY